MTIIEHIYIKRIENDEHGQEQYAEARMNIWGMVIYIDTGRRRRFKNAVLAHETLIRNGWKWKKAIELEG